VLGAGNCSGSKPNCFSWLMAAAAVKRVNARLVSNVGLVGHETRRVPLIWQQLRVLVPPNVSPLDSLSSPTQQLSASLARP